MNCVHIKPDLLIAADKFLDYVPIVSTVTNLVDLFQKLVVVSPLKKEEITANRYYTYLNEKSNFRCVLLLVPVLGNVAVIIYDCLSKYRANAGSKSAEKPKLGEPKPAEKPKLEEPKPAEKPKLEEPKPAEKPKLGEPKPAEKPKLEEPKPAEKPKLEEPKPAEKPKLGEPKPAEKPKLEEPKPAEKPKLEEPKPAEKPKLEEPKPAEKPKLEEPKPAEKPKLGEPKPAEKPKLEEPKPAEKPKLEEKSIAEIIKSTLAIENNFTLNKTIESQREAHQNAKKFLTSELKKIGGEARFVSHSKRVAPSLKDVQIDTNLMRPNVVKFQYTQGVLGDIKQDGRRATDDIIMYGVASQFNGCEAPSRYTVQPGQAVRTYGSDRTQGPQAQLAFSPEQVELINCAGNLGFNGLCPALSKETKAEIAHGYFTPAQDKADLVIQQLRNNGHLVEYSCIANKPLEGQKPVHIALVAAPAFGMYAGEETVSGEKQEEIQFLCALNGYRAQLEECVRLTRETGKSVIFKPAAVGLGVFSNDPKIVAKALYQALLEYQDELETSNSQVIFQVFNSIYSGANREAMEVVKELALSEKHAS